ncbi:hypothetical protein [Ralstonia pickettii]|uniref:hypothetical protein n=1 Tax=Ralstonia pickettii TaxID=329 RepID=UPI0015F7FE80|nr:hypothetical protein [Ralstonia pickettii]MBB0024397.1 hypothetical protein [Ralstonia pickettii]MBB0035274.1 hypothetical protein [Ralstonia pickettii]MBB0097725.1 hypothetical protein [Ralstonia pickettii]MBB0107422.1 hypothetical protein [Ralstonia pickettii]MBB0128499.1 hypothetical protein [Ralstonia pickettii]
MPFIIAALALVGLQIYGALRLYAGVAAAYGAVAGGAAVLLAVALLAGAVVTFIRRYRAVHGVNVEGQRIVSLSASWGQVAVDAEQKRGTLQLHGQDARFLFADIAGADSVEREGAWTLALRLKHQTQADWPIPMRNRREAKRWAKIFALAASQEL